MEAAVIIATYNWPAALELVLWGYAVQRVRASRIIVADDGSGPETQEVIARIRRETGLAITHVWHPDRGFRKCEILNRAIHVASEPYLIFTDGDVIPRDDFVAVHTRHARRGRFLAGMTVRLPYTVSDPITPEDVRAGRATELGWLWRKGLRPGRHLFRFSRNRAWNTAMDYLTTTRASWRGGNSSAWRDDLVAVNGHEMTMGYGGQDEEIGTRLINLGVKPRRVRFEAMTVHLDHDRPWRDENVIASNMAIRREVLSTRRTRSRLGLADLDWSETQIRTGTKD